MEGLLQRVFERHPRRYAWLVVAGALPFCLLATSTGIVSLSVGFGATVREFVAMLTIGIALTSASVAGTYVSMWKPWRPLFRWLGGDREGTDPVAVWHVLNDSPRVIRRGLAVFIPAYVPFPFYAVGLLDQPPLAYLGVSLGILIAMAWAAVMVLLWLDYAMRPGLVAVSAELPSDFVPVATRLSARRKLLVSSTVLATANMVFIGGLAYGLELEPSVAFALFIGVALIASFTVARVGNTFSALSMFGPVRDLMSASRAVGAGDLTKRVPLTSRDEFGQLAHAFNQMVRGLAEREVLQSALGAYVDPRVAERLLAEGELLDGEYVDVTVLFLDIRDFTTISEHQDAAETVSDLNALFGIVVPIVAMHGGHVNKFTGDGLLAVFGAPERHDDHADRALAAAHDIAAMIGEIHGDEMRIGIGINSGKVVAGTIGGGGHLEFAVIGDAVNVASRVEGLTKETGDTILITEQTKQRLNGSRDDLHPRGTFTLRGRAEPMDVYALRSVLS